MPTGTTTTTTTTGRVSLSLSAPPNPFVRVEKCVRPAWGRKPRRLVARRDLATGQFVGFWRGKIVGVTASTELQLRDTVLPPGCDDDDDDDEEEEGAEGHAKGAGKRHSSTSNTKNRMLRCLRGAEHPSVDHPMGVAQFVNDGAVLRLTEGMTPHAAAVAVCIYARESRSKANCVLLRQKGQTNLVTVKPVAAGEELFVSFEEAFWLHLNPDVPVVATTTTTTEAAAGAAAAAEVGHLFQLATLQQLFARSVVAQFIEAHAATLARRVRADGVHRHDFCRQWSLNVLVAAHIADLWSVQPVRLALTPALADAVATAERAARLVLARRGGSSAAQWRQGLDALARRIDHLEQACRATEEAAMTPPPPPPPPPAPASPPGDDDVTYKNALWWLADHLDRLSSEARQHVLRVARAYDTSLVVGKEGTDDGEVSRYEEVPRCLRLAVVRGHHASLATALLTHPELAHLLRTETDARNRTAAEEAKTAVSLEAMRASLHEVTTAASSSSSCLQRRAFFDAYRAYQRCHGSSNTDLVLATFGRFGITSATFHGINYKHIVLRDTTPDECAEIAQRIRDAGPVVPPFDIVPLEPLEEVDVSLPTGGAISPTAAAAAEQPS